MYIDSYQLITFFNGEKNMKYKKIMILTILFVSLLAISAVSAAENTTDDIVGVEETTDEVVSVEENQEILKENEPGTFYRFGR